ncbi:unnamed protein product [Orchesella dallaii]|uniref:Uncharacterized protein n=1 Tax=Orchesella dallaii TaxID=48710 RepID=A0ABP1QM23_9HEXA
MSSAGAGSQEFQEEDAAVRGLIESVKNQLESSKKLIQFTQKCTEVKLNEQSVVNVHEAISREILQYKQKENRLRRALRLAEAMSPGQMEGPYSHLFMAIENAREALATRLLNMESKLRQAAQERVEWEELVPFRNPGFEWDENREELENQLEETKIKVEAGKTLILQLKEEWESAKPGLQGNIETGSSNVEMLFDAFHPLSM